MRPTILLDSAHSTAAKVLAANGLSNEYLRTQQRVEENSPFDQAVGQLESILNHKVACDVACGQVNVLTTKSIVPEGENAYVNKVIFEIYGENDVKVLAKRVNGEFVPLSELPVEEVPAPSWDAFWDPQLVGANLPLSTANGARLYEASNKSAVGIEGRGTVEDTTVRSSHETVLGEYSKQVSAHLAQESLTPQQEMVRAVDNIMKGATNAPSPLLDDGAAAPLQLPSAILNFDFPEAVEDIRRKLCPLAPRIQVVPYKIVTYSEGDYFLPHVDSMDHNAMQFGSLALQLPFTYRDEEMERALENGGRHEFPANEEPISQASGELVFYVGRHLEGHIPEHFDEEGVNFRNMGWMNYERPRTNDEQLRMRVDLTSSLPPVEVNSQQVGSWVTEKSGQAPSTTTSSDVEFQVQPLKYAAWQGDIPHEVTRITSVYRTVVLYRLIKVFDGSDEAKAATADPLPFLTSESQAALSVFAGESVVTTTPYDLVTLPSAGDNDSLETVWERFEAQTAALKSYRGISYSSLVSPSTRGIIHGAVAKAVYNFLPPDSPPIPTTLEGTRLLQYVVDTLQTTPQETDAVCGPVTHLGFILRHQYAPAVQRIIHELQSPISPHAQALPYGIRRRLIIALLKGADAVVYTLLTEIGEVSVHAAHQVRSDFTSSPYRLSSVSNSRGDPDYFGQCIQKIYPASVALASEKDEGTDAEEGDNFEHQIDVNDEMARENADAMFPVFVDCAWVVMGFGKLLGGGQSYGNADCGSDWWYRNSVMVFNPRRTSPIFWRHRLLLLALRKTTTSTTPLHSDEVEPVVKILRTLLACPDVFGHVASFL